MQPVAQPEVLLVRTHVAAYPAPLCETCNTAMALNGEYGPAAQGAASTRREYQCRMCGAARMVRRTIRSRG